MAQTNRGRVLIISLEPHCFNFAIFVFSFFQHDWSQHLFPLRTKNWTKSRLLLKSSFYLSSRVLVFEFSSALYIHLSNAFLLNWARLRSRSDTSGTNVINTFKISINSFEKLKLSTLILQFSTLLENLFMTSAPVARHLITENPVIVIVARDWLDHGYLHSCV